jgi:hypothetical protein
MPRTSSGRKTGASAAAAPVYSTLSVPGLGDLLVHESRDGPMRVVRVGLPDRVLARSCVTFLVPPDDEEPIALDWVGYDSACTVGAAMSDGGGATVAMLGAAIRLVFDMLPRRTHIELMDTSDIPRCFADATARRAGTLSSAGGGTRVKLRVPLAYHSILLHGHTWYQRHFGAEVVPFPAYRARTEEAPDAAMARVRRALAQPVPTVADSLSRSLSDGLSDAADTPDAEFDAWFERHVTLGQSRGVTATAWLFDPRLKAAMRGAWRQGGRWTDFFRRVNDACGCGIFSTLCDSVARESLGLNMRTWSWRIPRAAHVGGGGGGRAVSVGLRAVPAARRAAASAFFRSMDRLRVRQRE